MQKLHHKPILNRHLPQTALFIKAAPASISFYHMETHGNTQEAALEGKLFICRLMRVARAAEVGRLKYSELVQRLCKYNTHITLKRPCGAMLIKANC